MNKLTWWTNQCKVKNLFFKKETKSKPIAANAKSKTKQKSKGKIKYEYKYLKLSISNTYLKSMTDHFNGHLWNDEKQDVEILN